MTKAPQCTLVGTVKDEGPYLLEWICYYKLIGFDQIVIASNDSSDGTRQMLDYLDTVGEITHIENSGQPAGTHADPQNRAYQRAWQLDDVQNADWVLIADADEFLNIHAGDGTMTALFAAIADMGQGQPDLISAVWRVFGNSQINAFVDEPVIAQFDQAAPQGVHRIQRYTAFKTLFRPKFVARPSIHRPRLKPRFRDGLRPCNWVNGSGEPMPSRYLTQGWRFFEESYGDQLVSMNHYMIKSSEAFLMKRYRGTANSADQERIDFSYFDMFNANDTSDTSIQRHVSTLRGALSDLKTRHPFAAQLHEQSIAFHRKRISDARDAVLASDPDMAIKLGLSAER
ncbi:glycosyltransferase family 2 protein [Yoonia sp. F2084L]|uniref:glycosyltransferase family 2 protein n=1 Tax=Yoonia sp. F2084L TaxID=2926419 RepID=UPI001FF1B5F8|nr:glycosyltransferase family 2 protein [Yoonia sp. F2084L]MCK0094483.1 glycosyltransferase family 2 protein [Yoonia sp. F2084L]